MEKIILTLLIPGLLIPLNVFPQSRLLSYPYVASPERQKFIIDNYKTIKINQTEQEVKQLLGTPEEIFPLYEPKVKHPKKIGFTFWYILQRLKENGSQNEKAEKLVRISFNLEGKVIAIDQWGFENKTP